MIYADNAATTKLDKDAFEAMKPYLLEMYGNPSQPYKFGRQIKKEIKRARIDIAECIGAAPDEIYFTSGGSESDNWAIKGILDQNTQPQIITSEIEHHAILNACNTAERFGFNVTYLPVDEKGIVKKNTLSQLLRIRRDWLL